MYNGMMGTGRGVGAGMGAIYRQRQTLSYLQDGKTNVRRTVRGDKDSRLSSSVRR